MLKLGWIGLGRMGLAMSSRLLQAGHVQVADLVAFLVSPRGPSGNDAGGPPTSGAPRSIVKKPAVPINPHSVFSASINIAAPPDSGASKYRQPAR